MSISSPFALNPQVGFIMPISKRQARKAERERRYQANVANDRFSHSIAGYVADGGGNVGKGQIKADGNKAGRHARAQKFHPRTWVLTKTPR